MLETELLQVALGNRTELSCTPSDEQWEAIYRFANEQAITGVLFGGIERLPKHQLPGIGLLMNWYGQTERIKQQNKQANEDCEKVTRLFRNEGFRTTIMKGQGNCRFYKAVANTPGDTPRASIDLSMLRTPGDIDILVEGGFEKVNAFVQRLCPTKDINELEIQLRHVCKTPVEVHYRPLIIRNPWWNRRLQKYLDRETEMCFRNGMYTTLRFNLIHQLAHVRLHLFTEGIGMKQMVDYYFLLSNADFGAASECSGGEVVDKAELAAIIDSLGMRHFAMAMMWVMKEVLLLSDEKLFCDVDEEGGRLLIGDVMEAGNFGRTNQELKYRKEHLGYGMWTLLVRNLRYARFDRWDWICGPAWRIYHRMWRMAQGYR